MRFSKQIVVFPLSLAAAFTVNCLGEEPMPDADKLRIFIASDSTAALGDAVDNVGWGTPFADYFDPTKVKVLNRAVGGRSSRTFITEGHWANLLAEVRAGDLVLIQFGHNDMGAINEEPPGSEFPLRARGSIKGLGNESELIDNVVTGKRETVYTYGYYMRKMVSEARAKGAIPILLSLTARNIWNDGRLERGAGMYREWTHRLAGELEVPFIDLTQIMVRQLESKGQDFMSRMYPKDHTHANFYGADAHAAAIVYALKKLNPNPVEAWLSTEGKVMRFLFAGNSLPGREGILVNRFNAFDSGIGYGFDLGTSMDGGGKPFYFSVAAAEGNYRVTIEFGHETKECSTTVKSETRRLMLEDIKTNPSKYIRRSIVVNVRNDKLIPPEPFAPGGKVVVLNDRETGKLVWDEKLTLEFNGTEPWIRSIQVELIDVPTVYLIGDSTVSDQRYEPAASWGQMLPRFFKDTVAVANHAESGETIKSFISGLRLAKVLQLIKEGDYLFIQFAHNDQKPHWPQTYVEANSTYQTYLKVLIAEARLRGATPVLVTSMERRKFDNSGRITRSLGDYPEAMRAVANEEDVALIDLEPMSIDLYETLGVAKAPLAFNKGGADATHHNNFGAYQLAQCVAQGIIAAKLPLADCLIDAFTGYDPKQPDDVHTFHLTPSPSRSNVAPLGN